MKRCPRCGEVKPLAEFSKNAGRHDGVQSMCKVCRRLYDHERYERSNGRAIAYRPLRSERGRGAWLRELKDGKPCADCGGTFPYQVMQWDHKPGYEKLGDVSADFWGRTRDEVLAEIAKCDLVCTNCHTIRTFTRSEWGQKWLKDGSLEYAADLVHKEQWPCPSSPSHMTLTTLQLASIDARSVGGGSLRRNSTTHAQAS